MIAKITVNAADFLSPLAIVGSNFLPLYDIGYCNLCLRGCVQRLYKSILYLMRQYLADFH